MFVLLSFVASNKPGDGKRFIRSLGKVVLAFFHKPPIIKAHFSNVGLSVLIDLLASCLLLIINRVVVTFEKHINENFHVFSCITSLFRCTYYAKTSRSSVVDHRLSI